jgi:ribosomal-protein-serine acetyltransferase
MDPLALPPTATLRPLIPADAPDLHRLVTANRAHLDRWLRWSSGVQTLADAAALIALFEEKQRAGDGFHLGLRVDGALAGGCVCWCIHRQNRHAELGYWLDAGHTGRGLATRMAAAVVGQLFQVERLHRVEMLCAVENRASRAIPERLGFRLEGIKRESHWITTRFLDHAVYGLLEGEWRAGPP